MAKQKYYVVWKGLNTGIFTSWDDCKKNVNGVQGAKYKSFSTKEEAEIALDKGWQTYYGKPTNKQESGKSKQGSFLPNPERKQISKNYIEESISVDAACSGNPGPMEYQGVYTKTGKTLFHFGPIQGTNNIGEFLAIIHGLSYLKQQNLHIPIYSDSLTAIKWVKMKKANTSLPLTTQNEKVWQLIKRGEKWLQSNTYDNPIIKWETEIWGENKADFGRK